MHNNNIKVILFCEIIINRVVLIFVDFMDFMVHVKLENQDPTKYNFSRLLPLVLEHNGVWIWNPS
jgi:hypothetical protein